MLNKIPIRSTPNQTFLAIVEINGKNVTYQMKLIYRDKIEYWTLDVYEYETAKPLIVNVPLLRISDTAGDFDLLKQMSYKLIGSLFLIKEFDTEEDSPGFSSIQDKFSVVWGDNYGS